MNHDSNNVNEWLMANKQCLNLSKTEYTLIGSRHNINNLVDDPCISVDGKRLNRATVTESLGIHVVISRLKPFVCRDTLISVYNALVQTYFDYFCEVSDPIGNILSNK